jgi:hypothetical protein
MVKKSLKMEAKKEVGQKEVKKTLKKKAKKTIGKKVTSKKGVRKKAAVPNELELDKKPQGVGSKKSKKGMTRKASVPRHKMSKGITCIVDKEHSQFPFFQVYRIVGTSTLKSSMKRMMACKSEVILAKLFVTTSIGRRQQLIFTNRRIIVLCVATILWDAVWRFINIVEKIPVIGWILGIPLGGLEALIDSLFRRSYRQAEKLNAVSNEATISLVNRPEMTIKRIMGDSIPYTKIVQPSLGVTIRQRWLAFGLSKIRGTTLRFIPVGRLRSMANRFVDAANFLLPSKLAVNELMPVLRALMPYLPSGEIDLIETKNGVSILWPAYIGIGTSRWSVRAANAVTIILTAITLFYFFAAVIEEDEVYGWLAVFFGVTTFEILTMRRFGEVMYVVSISILVLIAALL